jgi:hypothetical protein
MSCIADGFGAWVVVVAISVVICFGVLEIRQLRLLGIGQLRGDGRLIGGGEAHRRLDRRGFEIDASFDSYIQRRKLFVVGL